MPGDVLRMEVHIERLKGRIGRGRGLATVDGEKACEAELMFAFADKEEAK
jgi:3-hydroxyacyl-[acyl-carrier-protein] dehydratase